ncbi:uncharacterized protein [Prorops nasuta]|uniref:uncharacterized protein n=1 Tax=Prorops nasuta TaxID=863751 RepID=UPI0034D02265
MLQNSRNILISKIFLLSGSLWLLLFLHECRGRPSDFWYGWPGPVAMPFDTPDQGTWAMGPQQTSRHKHTLINGENHGHEAHENGEFSGASSFSSSSHPSPSTSSKHEIRNEMVNPSVTHDHVHTSSEIAYETRKLINQDHDSNGEKLPTKSLQRPGTTAQPMTKALPSQRILFQQQNHYTPTEDTIQSDGKIFFPDDRPVIQKNPLRQAPICKGKTYCEDAPYYPEDVVNTAVRMDSSLPNLATVDITEVVQRFDITDDTPLCLSTEQVIYPKSAESRRKEWLFVVNQANFTQGVRIETCMEENSECKIFDSFAEGYKTMCKQKYIYRQLAAVSVDGKVIPEMFRFPSSCCCHVKFTGNSLSRMAMGLSGRNQTPANRSQKSK